jgi:hypothetical protein
MADTSKRSSAWDLADSGTVWFALLQRARRTGETSLAKQARRALADIGIRVSYQRCHRKSGPAEQRLATT